MTERTKLVAIIHVSSVTDVINDIKRVVKVAREVGAKVLLDGAQSVPHMPVNVRELGVDLLALSSHKILGPKGAGALYIREGVKIERIIHGALSTQRYWPDVENVPAIVGFYEAARLALEKMSDYVNYVRRLRDRLMEGIVGSVEDVLINRPLGDRRVADNVNVSFLYIEGEALTVELSLRGVYVSSGSACTSRVLEPSHVLLAIGRTHE
ncbi:MAG: hypothetical protein DRO14_04480 [Thermoprotei archaeon]|nr:MAG: hypothetical protein DRO14_04480 [Thermoprotei archaeon]